MYDIFDDIEDYDSFKNAKINEKLINYVFEDIQEDYSLLEKTIHIYMKLCKCLVYNEEFFSVGPQKLPEIEYKLDHIYNITPDNPEVLCYEFNQIYAKFLHDLGIQFEILSDDKCNILFGRVHENLKFKVEGIEIFADGVDSSPIKSDMLNIKLNHLLTGFFTTSKEELLRNKFKTSLEKVHKIINKEKTIEIEKPSNNKSLKERIYLIVEEVNKKDLKLVESLGYINYLKKIIFSEEELTNSIDFNFIRDKKTKDITTTSCIISYTEDDKFKYLYYIPGKQLLEISKEELLALFTSKQIEYRTSFTKEIPGLKM